MLKEFIEYLEGEVKRKSLYAWGGQGEAASETAIEKKESEAGNRKKVLNLFKQRTAAGYKEMKLFDCSGLGTYFFYNLKKAIPSDTTANGLKGKCEGIEKGELLPGDFVFRVYTSGKNKGRAYHIGYVVDEKLNVIEAQGRAYGVVRRGISAGGSKYWNAYGRPQFMKGEIEEQEDSSFTVSRLLKKTSPFMAGQDVRAVQKTLIAKGYSCGKTGADGEYGKNTEAAVKKFQKAAKLTADGIVGENTTEKLGGVWKAGSVESVTVSRLLKKKSPLMTGDDVKAVQKALIAKGYSCGKAGADGEYGTNTEKAVKEFQKAKKLTADGIAGKNTVEALGGKWNG